MGRIFRPTKYSYYLGEQRPILGIVDEFVADVPVPSPTPTPSATLTPTPTITPTLTPTPTPTQIPNLLFDTYTNGRLGYSVRKLKSSYSGYCMKVRRSSDNTTQDIGFVNNLLDTSSLLSFVGANDGFVDTWYDQSGNNENATAVSTSKQPIIVSGGTLITSNSLPSLRWDGVTNGTYLRTTTTISQPNTSFIVSHNLNPLNGGRHFYDGTARQLVGTTGGPDVVIYAGGGVVTDGAIPNDLALFSAIFDGSSSSIEVNNYSTTTGNPGTNGIGTTLLIGSGDPPSLSTSLDGYYSELVIFDANKTTDKAGIKSDIMTYYSLPDFDPDAQAFFNAITTAGGSLTTTEQDATNQLVLDLKGYGLWSTFDAFYPFVGSSATSTKFNLLDPRDLDAAYRITWVGGITYSSLGIKGLRSASGGNTHLNPTSLSYTEMIMGCWINQGLAGTPIGEYDMGGYDGSADTMITLGFGDKTTKYVNYNMANYQTTTNGTYTADLFIGQNDGVNSEMYQGTTQLLTSAQSMAICNMTIGITCSWRAGGATDSTNRGYSVAFIGGTALIASEINDLYTAINTFNTTLGR